MKKILLSIALIIPVLCTAQKTYTLHGTTVGAAEGDTVTITRIVNGKDIILGKVPVNKGKFVFEGKAENDGPIILRASPKDVRMGLSAKVFTDGKKIDVVLDTYDEDYNLKSIVSGTPLNDKYRQYTDLCKKLLLHLKQAAHQSRDTTASAEQRTAANNRRAGFYNDLCNYQADFVIENIRNAAGQSELQSGDFLFMPLPILQRIVKAIPHDLREEPKLAEMIAYTATLQATSEGQMFIDFAAPNPQGDTVRLSDYAGRGKYVLVDFWASWCSPCRASMPQLVELYAKYKDKGFEVVGVSLDTKKDAWGKAISDLSLPWPQMSDLKLWNSAGASEYGIKGIPCTVLIGPDGKIIARNTPLKEKLEEIFGK